MKNKAAERVLALIASILTFVLYALLFSLLVYLETAQATGDLDLTIQYGICTFAFLIIIVAIGLRQPNLVILALALALVLVTAASIVGDITDLGSIVNSFETSITTDIARVLALAIDVVLVLGAIYFIAGQLFDDGRPCTRKAILFFNISLVLTLVQFILYTWKNYAPDLTWLINAVINISVVFPSLSYILLTDAYSLKPGELFIHAKKE
jgi:hypothetical protein